MDQEKIGKFISECRKNKKMTQQELAEKLGVSDRTIGNWENGRNMPDLSLFKPLCEELDISINDLMSGEKIKKDEYQKKLEENFITTIDYTSKKISKGNILIGRILMTFGILISLTAMTIFPSESSFGSIYAIIGVIISLIGVSRLTKKFSFFKRLFCNISYFVLFIIILLVIDYVGVVMIKQAPRFSYIKITKYNVIEYKALMYNVFRVNFDTDNEYYIIDTKRKYTIESVPKVPFNRNKSGIENIIKYKSKYTSDNSNVGNLISNLPLSEYGYNLEIDSKDLGLTINYHVTDWYVNSDYYLEKSLIYNSVSLFALIDNLNYISFNFSGSTYNITRKVVQKFYPCFEDIVLDSKINKNNFNEYLERTVCDNEFVKVFFKALFIDGGIEETQKIIIKGSNSENIIRVIDNKDEITEIVKLLLRATKITGPVNLDGAWWAIYMYGNDDKLINKFFGWGYNGYSFCFGFSGKEYSLIGLDGEKINDLINGN